MANTMQDKERITTRVPHGVWEKLQEAADLSGATVNQFVVQSALEKAEEVIQKERVIFLSSKDVANLLKQLDSPVPAPSQRLNAAYERYKERIANGDIVGPVRKTS